MTNNNVIHIHIHTHTPHTHTHTHTYTHPHMNTHTHTLTQTHTTIHTRIHTMLHCLEMCIYYDTHFFQIGAEWSDVCEVIRKAHYQPLLLVYSNPFAEKIDVSQVEMYYIH